MLLNSNDNLKGVSNDSSGNVSGNGRTVFRRFAARV